MLALKTLQPLLGSTTSKAAKVYLPRNGSPSASIGPEFPQGRCLDPGPASAITFNYVMSWHVGATLQKHLDRGRHFSTSDVVHIGVQVAQGLGSAAPIVYCASRHQAGEPVAGRGWQDTHPRSARSAMRPACPARNWKPTPVRRVTWRRSCMPVHRHPAQSDIYATGICLYHLLTRKYPYGEMSLSSIPSSAILYR